MSKVSLPTQLRKVVDKDLIKTVQSGLEQVEEQLVQAVAHTDHGVPPLFALYK